MSPSSGGQYASSPVVRIGVAALAALVVAFYVTFAILTAKETLGCDYFVYRAAVVDWLAGQPVYDMSIQATGSCNVYYYPPPFLLLVWPFAIQPALIGLFAWIGFLLFCFVLGCYVLPVRPELRFAVLLVGAVSWPFLFGLRIGQVAPILFLLFALAWRWTDRPERAGAAIGAGILVKLQPIVVLVWFIGRRSARGLAASVIVVAVGSLAATVVGIDPWTDMVALLRNLDPALTNSANFSIGATAYRAGLPVGAAALVQAVASVAMVALAFAWAVRGSKDAAILVAIVASQCVFPVVWSHYALVLLLPVAWLAARGHWWAFIVPLAQAWILIGVMPPIIYPLSFISMLIAVPLVDARRRTSALQVGVARA